MFRAYTVWVFLLLSLRLFVVIETNSIIFWLLSMCCSCFVSPFLRGSCSIMCSSIRRCGSTRQPMYRRACTLIWQRNSSAIRKSTVMCDVLAPYCRQCTRLNTTIGLWIRVRRVASYQRDWVSVKEGIVAIWVEWRRLRKRRNF